MMETVTFKRIDILKIDELKEKIDFYKSELFNAKKNKNFSYINEVNMILSYYNKEYEVYCKQYNDILDFWENGLNKYYHVKFDNCYWMNEIYIFPYLITSNNKFIGAVSCLNDNYNSGLKDGMLDFSKFFEYNTTITEISKEKFIEETSKNIQRPLDERLKKIIIRKNIKK